MLESSPNSARLGPERGKLSPIQGSPAEIRGRFTRFPCLVNMPTGSTTYWKSFDPKVCSVRLKGATKDEILTELVENFISGDALNADTAKGAQAALEERERGASTGIGRGVAIIHVRVPGIDRAAMSLSIHKEGLDWEALDREPVHIIFTVLRPERASADYDPEEHIEVMRWVARLAQDTDFRSFAIWVNNKKELASLLKEKADV